MTDDMERLRNVLVNFDTLDLASGVGGLQLDPRNAERQLRFERIAALVASVIDENRRPQMSSTRWRAHLNRPPIAREDVLRAEDPAEDVFTSSISFIGGSYVVFPGITPDSVAIVRELLRAAFMSDDPMPTSYVNELRPFAYAALRLSDRIASRAMLARGQPPERSDNRDVLVPPNVRFSELRNAVQFSEEELSAAVSPADSKSLEPIIGRFGDANLDPDDDIHLGYCYLRPILTARDKYVVLMPSGLLVALRHRLVVRASDMGLTDELARRLLSSANDAVTHSLTYLGFTALSWQLPDSPRWTRETFWSFDSDKIAHVMTVADDLIE